jgi:hypothetical protein
VEEEAAVKAARNAVARARRAERKTGVLRRDMEKTVDQLENKVHEIKHRWSLAERAAKAERAAHAAARLALSNSMIPRWQEVPLVQPQAADLPAVALPPGSGHRGRGRWRGRPIRTQEQRSKHLDSDQGSVEVQPAEELPVMPPGGPVAQSRAKYSGQAATQRQGRGGASRQGLPVLQVADEGLSITIAAADSAALPPGPDMVVVTLADGGEQVLPYATNSRVPASGGGGLKLAAPAGCKFPVNAAYVRPAMQARFLVRWVSDGELHVDGWSEAAEGPGYVRAQLASGEVMSIPYARCQLVGGGGGASSRPHHVMSLHAKKGCMFPRGVAYVSPMAGSPWASPYHQGTIASAGDSYFQGLLVQVRSLSVDGVRMEVQGKKLLSMLEQRGRVVIREQQTCAMVSAFFTSSTVKGSADASGAGLAATAKAQLVAAPGTKFPDSAQQVVIPTDPVVAFPVYFRSQDGSQIRVQAPDNGALHRKGGVVVATRSNGQQALYHVVSAEHHGADEVGPEGMVLVAARGVSFPADIVRVSQGGPVLAEGLAPLNVEYVDAQGGYTYRVGKALGVGDNVYVDRDFLYTALPESLKGHTYILSAMGDAGVATRHSFVTLMVDRPADVYVLYDARAREPPQWLSSAFQPVGGAVETTSGPMAMWKSKMMIVGSISLGGNAAFPAEGEHAMYAVVVLPAAAHRARPPSARIAAAAMSSMQYPVVLVSARGDTLSIMARPTSSFPSASEENPQSLQVQKKDGSIVEAVYVGMEVLEGDGESPPQLKFRASPVMSFPAEATGASPAAVYQVVYQSPDGSVMRVDCPNDGRLPPGPGRVKVKMSYGRQADFPYASLRATAGGIELRAPQGLGFPADAVACAPAAMPLADPVLMVSPDATSMRLLVADTALYFPGASMLRVVIPDYHGLRVERIRYSGVQYVAADVNGPAGLQFTAAEGEVFPKRALAGQSMAFPVLSVKPDGSQMEVLVPSAASFPRGPCEVKLKSVDGDDVSIPYTTSALLASKADGKIRLLLLAQEAKPFPRMPAFAEPNCVPRAYEAHPSRPVLFPILSYAKARIPGVTRASVTIQATAFRDGFLLNGGYAKVYCSGGDVLQVPYTQSRERRGTLTLTLPRGATLPGDAVQLAPESAPVIAISNDNKMLQLAAPNDGSFLPGPGVVFARLLNGKEKRLKYESMAFLRPGGAAGGMLMTAAVGHRFPSDVVAVRPSPDETTNRPEPSKVVDVRPGGRAAVLNPESAFPSHGIVAVDLPDGTQVHVDYVSSHLSAAAFAVALPDGSSVNVPSSYVKHVGPHAKVTLADGTQHTVALSAVQPRKRDPATTQVLVTLPDGQEVKVPETSIQKDESRTAMMRVTLDDNQRVEVPASDVLPVHRTYMVHLAGRPAVEVPEARVCPCSCTDALEDCQCSCSSMASARDSAPAPKFQVELPDGSKVKVLPDELTVGRSTGTRLTVSLPGGGHATVPAKEVQRHVLGIPDGMVQVRLAGGAVQVVSEASLKEASPQPDLYQVLLPDGVYSLVGANAVSQSTGMVTVKLVDGGQVKVPESNVHQPAPELRVHLNGGRVVDVLPSDVTFAEAHLQVLLPNGKTVNMAASRVSKVEMADGAPAELVLEAADGAAFPADAQYVTPIHAVPLEATQTSEDGRRLVVVAPPDSLPDGLSRVRVILSNGRTSELDYESAYVLSGSAEGPFMPIKNVARDGSWIEVPAPAALPPAPGMLRAALEDGKQTDVMYSAMEARDAAGLLRLLSRPGYPFPADIVKVAEEGPRKVLLTARRGESFPPQVKGVLPLHDVQTSFPVVDVMSEGVRMRVDARDDGTFPQGPGVLRVRVRGGTQMLVAYDSVAVCMPDLTGPEGLVFTSPHGLQFPEGAEMVQATSGFGHSDGAGGANEELLAQVVSNAESQETLGPPCAVIKESADGSQLQVAPYGLFSDSGGFVDVKIADGAIARIKYDGVKREEDAGYVTVQTLLAARGSRFPDHAAWVQPVVQQKLQVGTAEAGSELYSDDPAHQITSVPAELRGSKLILTDNAARGSKQANQLTFTVWGWSRMYILRPDAKCDMTKAPVVCQYLSADLPKWLEKNFKPRPDLLVTTTDGSMAVYESLHPIQGPVALGGNADVRPERLVLSTVVAKSPRIYKTVNATHTTSLYVDRIVTVKDLPEELQDEPMIQAASVDKDSTDPQFLTVVLSVAADCYVLRDNSKGDVPVWMSRGFLELPGLKIKTSEGPRNVMQSRLPLYGQVYFGGNGGGTSMYTVICVATKYSENTVLHEPRVAISQVQMQPDLSQGELGSEMAALVEQQPIDQLYVGLEVYVDDEDIRVLKVPAQLQGAMLVRTARMDKDRRAGDVLSFYVSQPADIYIARDDRPSHSWLPVAAVAYPGDASGVPSRVLFVTADGTKMRVRADTPFPPGPAAVIVRDREGREVEVEYSEAVDAESSWQDSAVLLPGGVEIVAKHGQVFPSDAATAIPAGSVGSDVTEMAVIGGGSAFPHGPGLAVVRTRDGEEETLRYASSEVLDVPSGGEQRIILKAPKGESYPKNAVSVRPVKADRDALPQWLAAGFALTDMVIQTSRGPMHVYKSRLPVDDRVVLGGNAALPAQGSLWGNYAVLVLPAGAHHSRGAAAPQGTGAWHLDNYVVAVRPVGAADMSPGAPGSLAVGATSAFLSHMDIPKSIGIVAPPEAVYNIPTQYSVVGLQNHGSRLLVQVQGVDGSFPPASPKAPQRLDVMQATGAVAEFPYVNVEIDRESQENEAGQHPPVLAFKAPEGVRFPPDAVAASPAARFVVISMDGARRTMVVASSGAGMLGISAVKVRIKDGSETQIPVEETRVEKGRLVVVAQPPALFPADSTLVGPAANPPPVAAWTASQRRFPVYKTSKDGRELVIQVTSETDVVAGPEVVVIEEQNGKKVSAKYETAAMLPRMASGAMLVQLTAPPGNKFPAFAKYVDPQRAATKTHVALLDAEVAEYKVVSVQATTMVVRAEVDGTFMSGPARVRVTASNQGPVLVPYASVRPYRDGEGPSEVIFVAATGHVFPVGAFSVTPEFEPIISVRPDGLQLQVKAPDDGTFPPGPAALRLELGDGSIMTTKYAVAARLFAGSSSGGVLLTAEKGKPFPLDAISAAPEEPRTFQVCEAAADGTELRVSAPNDGSFQPAPSRMSLILSGLDGVVRHKVAEYESLTVVPASDACPAGLLLRGDFGRELMAATAVSPMGRHDNEYGPVLHDVACQGVAVCKTGLLRVGSPLHADELGAEAQGLPRSLQGLEYIRTPASPKGLHGPGVVSMTLTQAADVFIMVPEIQSDAAGPQNADSPSDAAGPRNDDGRLAGAGLAAPSPWFSVLRSSKDSTKLVAIVPTGMDVPGPAFPAAPWVVKVITSDGATSTHRYVSVRRLPDDGAGEAVAVGSLKGQVKTTALHDLKDGYLIEVSSPDWGGAFPDGAFRVSPVPGFEPPEWMSRQFVLTSLTVPTTKGSMLVWKSREPMRGHVSLEGLLDAPAPRPVTVSHVQNKGPTFYKVETLTPGSHLYVDSKAVVLDVPAVLSGMSLIRTAVADAANEDIDFMRFTVDEASHVYLLASGWGGAEPSWLSTGFERTQFSCRTSMGLLAVWRSLKPLEGDVDLGGNNGAATMYAVVVVPEPRSQLPMSENYVVAVRCEPSFDPIGLRSAFADAAAKPASKAVQYPQSKDLAVYPVSYVDATSIVVQCDADAPFPPAPGRMQLVLQDGKTVDVAYTAKDLAQRQTYVVETGQPTSRSELVVVPPSGIGGPEGKLPQGSGTAVVELADGAYVNVPYAEFQEIPTLNPRQERHVLVVAAPGHTFPPGALTLSPAKEGLRFTGPPGQTFPLEAALATPSPQFQVTGLSLDGTKMRVAVPDDGTFDQGPSELSVVRSDGTELSLPYSQMFPVAATATEPSGIVFMSRPGESYPEDSLLAGPAAGPALRVTDIKLQLGPDARAPPAPADGYLVGTLGYGKPVYADRKESFVDVPDALLGSVYVETSAADSASTLERFLTFHLNEPAFVVLLVESPKKKDSWVPYWFPEFLGGAGGTEQLPLWMSTQFKHTGLQVLSTDTRYEVLMSKKRLSGMIVLGGNAAAPSVGSRKMYDVVVCRRNVTAYGNRRLFHSTLNIPGASGAGTTASNSWTGVSTEVTSHSWFPVSAVKGNTMTVQAMPGSFKTGGGQVHVHGSDGSEAVLQYVEARHVVPSKSWFSYELTMAVSAPVSAAYVRPTSTLPQSEWAVRSVSPGGHHIILNAPEDAFPEPPAMLSLIVPGHEGRIHVAYVEVKSVAGGTATQISATQDDKFPAAASFAGVADPDADGPPQVTNIRVTPDGARMPTIYEGPPARASTLQYDVSTVGLGKRLWVDGSETMKKIPASLAGDQFIMTADQDKDLNQPGQSSHRSGRNFCALSFYVTRPADVLVASVCPSISFAGPCVLPKWLSRDFVAWIDPETGKQGLVEADDGSKLLLLRLNPLSMPSPTPGEVCLGGLDAFPRTKPKHNYVVIIVNNKRALLNGPLSWDGTPMSVKTSSSPGKWFAITSRSDDGATIRVAAKGLQDGFSAPLDPKIQGPGPEEGSAGFNSMDDALKHAHDEDDIGLIMIKGCDSAEAPYTVMSMRPVPADENQGAGIEMTVGPGLSFPSCVSYARPYFDSIDGPPGEAFAPPKPAGQRHGRIEFAMTTAHVPVGSWSVKVPVVRQGGNMGPVSVRYFTSDGTAHKSTDYKFSSGWLVWKDGDDSPKTIEVPLAAHAPSPQGSGDWIRFFTLMLSDPTGGASLGHPSIVSVQIDSHGPLVVSRLPPSASDASNARPSEFTAETTSADSWKYPVVQVTGTGAFMKVVAPPHSPFAARGAMKLECADGRQEDLNYKSVAPAASVEMQVIDVSEEGYVMVVLAKSASVPPGPGLMNLRDKGGNLAQVVYNSAVQSEGPHVVLRAPIGFPFPGGAMWAWADSTLLLEAPDYQPFPTFLTQSPVAECSVMPSPLAASSGAAFPVTFVSPDGTTVRLEAPSDSPFPPRGRLDFLKPDGSRQVLRYGAVEVLPPATYRVLSQSATGDRMLVEVLPQHGLEPGTHVPAFPQGPGELIVSVGAERVLVSYAYATAGSGSKTSALVFAPRSSPFPANMGSVALTSTGLLFSHVVGLEGPHPATKSIVDFSGPVSGTAYPVSAQLGLPVDYNTDIDETDPEDERVKWFPLVDMAADGSYVRIQAPAGSISSARGIIRLQEPNGEVQDVGYSSATVEPALPFRVYAVIPNASQCIVRAHPFAFPPGPGSLLVTRAGKTTIKVRYSSATPMAVGSGLLRITAQESLTFPADSLSVTPTVGLVRLQARVGDSFPPSVENAASQAVAIGLSRFLHTGAESDGFYVVGVSRGGSILHLSAPVDARFPPAGVVSIGDAKGRVSRFPYDKVREAPEVQLVIEDHKEVGSRYFQVKTDGYALPPHGVLIALVPGEDPKLVAYEAVRPASDKPSREGWAEVALVRGQTLPKDTIKVSLHPRGLLLEAPRGIDFESEGALASSGTGSLVAISKAWPAGFGPVRFPVTAVEGSDTSLRVEAPPAQHAWSNDDQWGVMLTLPDGAQLVWPYEIALPSPEATFRVTWVASDGGAATVLVHDIALPAVPCIFEVTTRMGFIRRVHALSAKYGDNGTISLLAVPGHLWPVDAVAASPTGALEFLSYPGLPFPTGLVKPRSIAESWAEPIPSRLAKFSVVGVGEKGQNMTVAVPSYVHAFLGQADGGLEMVLGMENGGTVLDRFSYAGSTRGGLCSFEVAWVKEDGGMLALYPLQSAAFPEGPGVVSVLDHDGKSATVRVTQAAVGRESIASQDPTLIHVTAAPGDLFSSKAKDVEFDCITLLSRHGRPFPVLAVDGPVSISWARPPPSESDRSMRQRRSRGEAERSGHKWKRPNADRNEADDAAGGAGPGGGFPFQYTITHVATDGTAVDVFVPEGMPEPEFVSTFELTCDARNLRRELWTGSEQHISAEGSRVSVVSVADDGTDMVLALGSDAAFPAGPGLVQLSLADGSSEIAPYESVVPTAREQGKPADPGSVGNAQVLLIAPSGVPFPTSASTALPLGETLRLFTAQGSLALAGAAGCLARPVKSRRFHKEPKSIFAGKLPGSEGAPEPVGPAVVQVHHAVSASAKVQADPFLKPHPTVSALECKSRLQYTVGTLGEGKRAYVDDDVTWKEVPSMLLGRPVVMTAVQDATSEGAFISFFVDEPCEVYVLLPTAKKTQKAKAKHGSQLLPWLPFRIPSLSDGKKHSPEVKDDIPAWMQGEYEVVPEFAAVLSDGKKFDVWRKKVPVLGFLVLGGNEGKTHGAKRGMYVAALVPATGSLVNVTVEENLPVGFPGNTDANKEVEGGVHEGPEGQGLHEGRGDGAHQEMARGDAHAARRTTRGSRGRSLARRDWFAALRDARHTRSRRHAIMKALKALKQRLAERRDKKVVTRGGSQKGVASGQRVTKAVGDGKGKPSKGSGVESRPAEQSISAADLKDMVERCGGKDGAGRCLVRAQACMSARSVMDPANCKCFADAVESFSNTKRGVCHASCMAAVEDAYNRHVYSTTGKRSPCLV